MIIPALILLSLQTSVHGQILIFAERGAEVQLAYKNEIQFQCKKNNRVLYARDRYSVRVTDQGMVFVISNVTESDHGLYTCEFPDHSSVRFSITVVGPVAMDVQQLGNYVDVVCDVNVTVNDYLNIDPRQFSLAFLDNNIQKLKVGIGNLDRQTLNYTGDLDPSIETHNLMCQASFSLTNFKAITSKMVYASYSTAPPDQSVTTTRAADMMTTAGGGGGGRSTVMSRDQYVSGNATTPVQSPTTTKPGGGLGSGGGGGHSIVSARDHFLVVFSGLLVALLSTVVR